MFCGLTGRGEGTGRERGEGVSGWDVWCVGCYRTFACSKPVEGKTLRVVDSVRRSCARMLDEAALASLSRSQWVRKRGLLLPEVQRTRGPRTRVSSWRAGGAPCLPTPLRNIRFHVASRARGGFATESSVNSSFPFHCVGEFHRAVYSCELLRDGCKAKGRLDITPLSEHISPCRQHQARSPFPGLG